MNFSIKLKTLISTMFGIVLILSVGCSKSKSGKNPPSGPEKPLSKTEKDSLKDITQSTGIGFKIVQDFLPNKQMKQTVQDFLVSTKLIDKSMSIPDNFAFAKIKKDVNEDNCRMNIPQMINTIKEGGVDIPNVELSIDGEGCPIQLYASIKPEVNRGDSNQSGSAIINYKFNIIGEEYKKLTDVHSQNFVGSVKIKATQVQPPGTNNININTFVELGLAGTGLSVKHGPFELSQNFKGNIVIKFEGPNAYNKLTTYQISNNQKPPIEFNFDFLLDTRDDFFIKFANVNAHLEKVQIIENLNEPKESYKINGELISKEEYEKMAKYLSVFSDEFNQNPLPPSEPQEPMISCNLNFYSKKDISFEDLKESLNSGQMSVYPKHVAYSCDGKNQYFSMLGKEYQLKFNLVEEFLFSTVNETNSSSSGAKDELELISVSGERNDALVDWKELYVYQTCQVDQFCTIH